jgi:hypothetical protein
VEEGLEGEATDALGREFSAGVSTVLGIPQTFSISVIAFTDMEFKSLLPSVTPSSRVLIRLPLHVILSVEAAFPSTIVPKTSKMLIIARRFAITLGLQREPKCQIREE